MTLNEDLYCKVFVDTDQNKETVTATIARILSATRGKWSLISTVVDIDVEDNEFFDQTKRHGTPDSFLHSRYYLDVDPTEGTSREEYISTVGTLLEGLWEAGFDAVAACEFEDELPRRGGKF